MVGHRLQQLIWIKMFDMNQLQQMLGNQKAMQAQQRMLKFYPLDGQKIAQKAIRHQPSRQLLQYINTNPKGKYTQTVTTIYKSLLDMCVSQQKKAVCAKIISSGDTVAECIDCRADPSCIICIQCFQNSNHKGHRVMFRKGMGGCCDCGDAEAWKQEGFCNKHTGQVQDVPLAAVQIQLVNELLGELYYLYSRSKLMLEKPSVVFKIMMTLFQAMTERGLKGIKFLFFFFQQQLPKHLVASSKLQGTIIKQLLNANFISRSQYDQLDNLFIAMFPYYPFKQLLISEYVACYSSLYAFDNTKGMSIACQIMTSYKLLQDYINSKGARPITIEANINVGEAHHLTKMMTYDFERIQKCQNDIPIKYWSLQIKHGVTGIFGYHQSLKMLARKEKNAATEKAEEDRQKKIKKGKKKRSITRNIVDQLLHVEQNVENMMDVEDDTSFSIFEFLIRNINVVECQFYIFDSLLEVLPLLAKDQHIMLELIRSVFQAFLREVQMQDDLLIFRPYERLFGLALFFYCKQNPFKLTDPAVREVIRQACGVSSQDWNRGLKMIQKRMFQTYGFFSHMQTCETSGYQTSFYTYLIIYSSSKLCLLGHLDILLLKETILVGGGGQDLTIDFPTIGKIEKLQKPNVWTLRAFSGLFAQLGMLYTGNFSQIYIAFYNQKAEPHAWLHQESLRALKKFITERGGSATLQKITEFSSQFLFKNESHLKFALKQICTFSKQKKTFTLLPQHIDKEPINYNDFTLRTQLQNKNLSELPSPQLSLQFIDKSNRIIFSCIWNENNIKSFCQIILELYDQVQKNKSKDQLIEFYAMPCKLIYLINAIEVDKNYYVNLNQILFNFDVSPEVRKGLGKLANSLSPHLEEQLSSNSSNDGSKQDMKRKKLKKLQELKKKKNDNLQKIKEMHEISHNQVEAQDQCVICRKSGGNLVWVAKMSIRNFQKLLGIGKGTLALSFTSCYHTFDEECIINNAIKRSTHDYLFRCPVCRTLGNVFFNLNGNYEQSFERMLHVAMTMRQYASFDKTQQIFKSFYHYVLLGYLQPAYLTQKRLKLYQQIVKNLKNQKLRSELLQMKEKLQNHKIVLQPKLLANKQKINLKEVEVYEQQFYSDQQMEDEDEEDIRIFENFLENERQQQMQKKEERRKKALNKLENKEKKQYANKQTPIFYYTLKRIINHILKDKQEKCKMQKKMMKEERIISEDEEEHVKAVETKVNKLQLYEPEPWLVTILDQLLEQHTSLQAEWNPPRLVKLIDLPEKYYWDMTDGTCDDCHVVCQDIFLCLLCKWKGCLNNCKKQGIKGHIKKKHGQSGAFLRLRDANAYLLGPGQLFKIGCLYTNEWGQQFNQQKDWNSYYLQSQLCDKVIGMILKNE